MSASIQSPPANNSRVVIITTVIAAMTTLGASLVGVGPQLLRLLGYNEEVAAVKQTIEGRILGKDGQPKPGVEVYLLSADKGQLTKKTGTDGRFGFSGLPSGTYQIILLDANGKSDSTFLFQDTDKADLENALVTYSIHPKGGQ